MSSDYALGKRTAPAPTCPKTDLLVFIGNINNLPQNNHNNIYSYCHRQFFIKEKKKEKNITFLQEY